MSILRISLFGSVRVTLGSWQEQIKLTRTTQLLLAYLILERNRLHPREVLVDLFWGDYSEARARNCLNTALWRLRRALEPEEPSHGKYLISSHTGEVGFNMECDCWLDVAIFEDLVNRVLKEPVESVDPERVQELEDGLTLYTGDLLESVYEDWALAAREHKRLLYLQSLDYLMRYYRRHGDHIKAIEHGNKILRIDPLREEVHRGLMQLYMENGQRSMAVRQYETCRQSLQDELGITPMEETRALYEQTTGANASVPLAHKDEFDKLLRELNLAHQSLELANKQFKHALRHLEEYTSVDK